MVQFFNDISTPDRMVKRIMRVCADIEKIAVQIEKSMTKPEDKKLSSLVQKQMDAMNEFFTLQGDLVESDTSGLDEGIKAELQRGIESVEKSLKDSLVAFDVSVNVKKTMLEYAKLQIEEQVRRVAGYDAKGEYGVDKHEMKKAMPPVAEPKNI